MEGIYFAFILALGEFIVFIYEIKKKPNHMLGWQIGAMFSILLACQWLTVGLFLLYAPNLAENERITIIQLTILVLVGNPILLAFLYYAVSRIFGSQEKQAPENSPGNEK